MFCTRKSRLPVCAALLLALATCASAGPLSDPVGDFLATYAGARNADMDVLAAEVFFDAAADVFTLQATLNGPVGVTPRAGYVFGFDRGAGIERFVTLTPSVGNGVFFDLIVLLQVDGSATVSDNTPGGAMSLLPVGTTRIDGARLSASIAANLLPNKGLAPVDYRYQLWPRLEGLGTRGIADFAPGSGMRGVNNGAAVTVVPVSHPAQLGLFMLALAGVRACAVRRRQVLRVAVVHAPPETMLPARPVS